MDLKVLQKYLEAIFEWLKMRYGSKPGMAIVLEALHFIAEQSLGSIASYLQAAGGPPAVIDALFRALETATLGRPWLHVVVVCIHHLVDAEESHLVAFIQSKGLA